MFIFLCVFFFKQKTAYEMRISDWSSDVCSSDLILNNKYFGEMNPRQIEYAQSIIDASQRLLALINDILDLATIEAGYMALDRSPVDVHLLLRSVYDLTREWAGRSEERRVGKECVSTCRSRWSPYH